MRVIIAVLSASLIGCCAAAEPRVMSSPVTIANLPLGVVTFPNGKAINLTVGVGSGAFRGPGDQEGRVWLVTDRGPNVDCGDAKELIGLDEAALCGGGKNGKIFPLPGFVPSIYAADIGVDNVARINVFLPLRGQNGKPVTGLPNPYRSAATEPAFSVEGKPIPADASGVDPEAIIRLADGSFWIAEEYGPSLLKVQADGTILQRLAPEPLAEDLKDAPYPVVGALPGILRRRAANRSFEGLAVSPDERFLYAVMQGPLAQPNEAALGSANLRILKIDRESGVLAAQYLYRLDEPEKFPGDNGASKRRQSDVRVSEVAAIGPDRLLIVERTNRTARIHRIDLENAVPIPARFDQEKTTPALAEIGPGDLEAAGLRPVDKVLILDTEEVKGLPGKIEAIAVMSPRELIVVNDNDFAVDGSKTQMFRLRFVDPVLQ